MNQPSALSLCDATESKPVHAAQACLTAIVESSSDAILGTDLDGIVTDWNPAAEKIFGYTAAEMVGTSIRRLIPPDRQEEETVIQEKIRRGENVEPYETRRQTKDGRLIHVSVTASRIRNAEGRVVGVLKITRDITIHKEHAHELSRLTRLYSAQNQINQAIVCTTIRDELFQKICQILVDSGGFHTAWVGWHDPATHRILPVAVAGKEPDYLSTVEIYSDDRPEGRGPTGQAFRTGQPFICNNMPHNPITLPWRAQLAQRGFQSSCGFPIRLKGIVCGALTVYSTEPFFFQEKEIALLSDVAGDISFALDTFADKEARERAEKNAENERLFSVTMIESMPGIVYFYDFQGRFLRWNRNFETVSGYTGEEIVRMHPLDFFAEHEKPLLQERITEVFAKGESSVEASFVARDGRATLFFFTGRRVVFEGRECLVGMGVDISERQRAELELRETQGQLEAVVENLREGLVIATPDARFLRWNPAALRMLGFTNLAEGVHRQHEFAQIFELSTLDGTILPFDQWPLGRVRRGEPLDSLELRVRRLHSSWERIFSYSGQLVHYAGNQTLAFMTLRDITEKKEAEMALRVLNQTLALEVTARTSDLQAALVRAEASDRVKSAFLATMSHELRTPLNSIIGFTGIVLQGLAGPLNDEQNKQLGMVRGSARHLLELINDILDLSKIEAGQLEVRAEPFDLRSSLDRVAALVKPMVEKKKLVLSVVAPPDLGEMVSDRRRVEQILINLVNNAVKFTEHGRVTLIAERPKDVSPPVVCLRVKDTGIGIKPEDLSALFQPFHQVDAGISRQHEGTGLGLAICRRLANLLGGEITVTSEWSKGSEFTATLPAVRPVKA